MPLIKVQLYCINAEWNFKIIIIIKLLKNT